MRASVQSRAMWTDQFSSLFKRVKNKLFKGAGHNIYASDCNLNRREVKYPFFGTYFQGMRRDSYFEPFRRLILKSTLSLARI